ncbi:hypothetical protein D7Y13_03980 [Corallococcus praedator]|uniref:Uncharacterized protein n=2 Tax=Myxococcaceae TaxID=31 RepID=A0ABX9QRM4_9BACT|nr:hypothetical protein D7X74_40980 [Corallococcus sp. CA047B]RKH34447.1 hypothetical protein D7X75_08350 [Corallococcus sp. CA031C]RKI15500.1 hypothetical protein D7Y13_03980 [Corallococcus praedator]
MLLLLGGLGLLAAACQSRGGTAEEVRTPGSALAVFPLSRLEALPEGSGGSGSAGEMVASEVPDFYGTVTAAGSRGFTVRDDDGVERPFEVAPSTRILRDGQRVPRAQLREGVMVHTTYGERLGSWVATDVEIYAGTPSRDLTATATTAAPTKR